MTTTTNATAIAEDTSRAREAYRQAARASYESWEAWHNSGCTEDSTLTQWRDSGKREYETFRVWQGVYNRWKEATAAARQEVATLNKIAVKATAELRDMVTKEQMDRLYKITRQYKDEAIDRPADFAPCIWSDAIGSVPGPVYRVFTSALIATAAVETARRNIPTPDTIDILLDGTPYTRPR